jgi:type II secretory pathway pseudopilin PulG
MPSRKERRRRAQAGTTLIELLVSVMIIGLVLVFLVGSFSTAVIDAALAKRNTAVTAATAFEVEKIGAAFYTSEPAAYSDCFAVDSAIPPTSVAFRETNCPGGTNLRADVTGKNDENRAGVQLWSVTVSTYPAGSAIGTPVSVYKVNRTPPRPST